MDAVIALDTRLFLFFNGLHVDWLDPVMAFVSSEFGWTPLYLFLAYLAIKKYGIRSVWFFLGVALLFISTDQLSAHFFKPYFHRFRPCHNEEIADLVYLPYGHCGGKYGFISSHACNVFGLAMFASYHLKSYWKYMPCALFGWAALIGYSRLYMGVHYPGDVICGAIVGLLLGFVATKIFLKNTTKPKEKCSKT